MSVLITSVLNCASNRLASSSSLSCIFSGALKCSVIWTIFLLLSWGVCYLEGRSLKCSPGQGNAGHCAMTLYVGEGPRGNNDAHSTLHRTSVTPSPTHNQTEPLWCWFPSGWACAHSRPLWVSTTTSPVRLGVSPAAAQPPRMFSLRGLRLYFPALEPWVTLLPLVRPGLSVHKCAAAGCYPLLCLPRSPPL